ncbi:hypothetical protein PHAVU_001G071700 [Phaseolus vulgaris]|uniref:Prolamin-like domain-containing protein n=1 Tax=Phaseolus vulgaris TaxID=3885 RepID=V7CTJ5_PHAVU|nr:hypothetical protein PHAVU_001G071700g [Phaseolus vulgaris]ESW33464.1 hypothetical protein PHAVU_001G071700g [Phaseolus vulgaris]
MATFHNFCLVLLLTISFTSMMKTGVSDKIPETSSPSSYGETNHAPRPLSSYEEYLQKCAAKLYPDCGGKIFSAIFFGNETVSSYCCDKLVNHVGKRCHEDMTKYILQSPNYGRNQIQILQRSENVWNDCVYEDYPTFEPADAPFPEITESTGAESKLFI